MNTPAVDLNVAEAVKIQNHEEIVEKRIKVLVRACLENPELNVHVLSLVKLDRHFVAELMANPQANIDTLEKFFKREIQWNIINQYVLHGKTVSCELCKETSVSGFWCKPCIHKNWCCYCCILLGFFRYG